MSSRLRCAIYTRKSTEEGLDQAFNSLHAQREACQAYVLSQAGEGWSALKTVYDDGGYSGGSMERPALKALLADVAAGKVDIVVVYKVDRLTRSLNDFARIVEVLDKAGASFVSVTQAFNTTTSMGRLTLNVLLSFAQFEREVTGERIRDKIAQSKARGIWMGGNLPLGYDTRDRQLVINEAEAEVVRDIFRTYIALGSVHALAENLAARGVLSKRRVSAKGSVRGGTSFSRGALFHLLRNRIYLGQIVHRAKVWPGQHRPIIDPEVFDEAQRLLEANRQQRTEGRNGDRSPLCGLIFDHSGEPMSPSHSRGKSGGRYRYYVSTSLTRGRKRSAAPDEILRAPASIIEPLVLNRLQRLSGDHDASLRSLLPMLRRVEVRARTVTLQLLPPSGIDAADRLPPDDTIEPAPGEELRIVVHARAKVRGGRSWLVGLGGQSPVSTTRPDPSLIKALRRAHGLVRTWALPVDDRPPAPASPGTLTDPYLRKVLRLAFLAPDIQRAILDGRQPAGLTLNALLLNPLPYEWEAQRRLLGFSQGRLTPLP